METFKSFDDLQIGGESTLEEQPAPRKKIETPKDMLEAMGLSFKDKEKPTYQDFFELAVKATGVMSEALEKVVIPLPIFQKTFMEYFKLKGSAGKVEFNAWFDKAVRRGGVGFKSLDKKAPILLFVPREEE